MRSENNIVIRETIHANYKLKFMKRKIWIYPLIATAALLLIIVSCKKDNDDSSATLPTVTTTSISNLTGISATSGGNITSDGGGSITTRGVCWNIAQNPTLDNSHTSNGTGSGSYASNMTGLMRQATYYVRAFATNSAGTAYGQQIVFTTPLN
jgi:hypothetical protein